MEDHFKMHSKNQTTGAWRAFLEDLPVSTFLETHQKSGSTCRESKYFSSAVGSLWLGNIWSRCNHSLSDTVFVKEELRIGTGELKEYSVIKSLSMSGGVWKVQGLEQEVDNNYFGLTTM